MTRPRRKAPPDAPEDLTTALLHRFADPGLLGEALTHPSATGHGARRGAASYQRLEFLGDRVLGLVVADLLFERFPSDDEGGLARRLTALVRRETLAEVAREIGLGRHLVLSKGEEDSGGRDNPATLADACEAVIAALFLDGGFEAAARFIRSRWTARAEAAAHPPQDAKTALQEWAHSVGKPHPAYRTLATEGPPHEPVFRVEVRINGLAPETARGPSKRAAEQAAAAALLEKVSRRHGG